ncbi:MAG: hypothetical protein WCR19_02340 [Acholeplasmataceae bacterium]
MGKYFGTDGIRGIAYEKLNEKLAFRLGQGLKDAIDLNQVVIGYDTRQSSPMLAQLIASGALSQGLDVLFIGVCSTPMLAYYSKVNKMIGIMVTASHNPYTDNGIKVFNQGYKTTKDEERVIESYIDLKEVKSSSFGKFIALHDFTSTYLKLYDQFHMHTKLKIAYDSANGANYKIAKKVFDHFQLNAIQIGNEPDGLNINKDCGSTHIEHLQNYLIENNLDIGFSFDGDGDRLIACDKKRIYDGDQIIYMIAVNLKQQNLLKNNKVVLTKMSNPGILKAFKMQGIEVILTDVGDKYVSLALNEHDAIIGGESSGHIILRHILHTGDGLLAAIVLTQILSDENKDLNMLTKDLTLYPYLTTNIETNQTEMLLLPEVITYLYDIKDSLGEDSLFIVRPSGTEPLIRITVSHQDRDIIEKTTHDVIKFLKEMEKYL